MLHWINRLQFIHYPVVGHLSCFHFSVVTNSPSANSSHRSVNQFGQTVMSKCPVWLLAATWTAARQASLFITNSRSLLKLMSIESVMPLNHFILCLILFLFLPSVLSSISVFSNESVFPSDGQSIGASASASVLPMNIQEWFPLRLTGCISLQSKGLSRVFSI